MPNIRSTLVTVAAIGAAIVGGAALASAATSSSSSTGTTSSSTPPGAGSAPSGARAPRPNFPAHGSAAHEDAEKPATGAATEQARAAAIKAAGGGTATSVTTDFTHRGYEVSVKKSDGSTVEIHLDSSFQAMPDRGGPHPGDGMPPAGAPGGSPPVAG